MESHFINGQPRQSMSETYRFDVVNPATGDVLQNVVGACEQTVESAVRTACKAGKEWAALPGEERRKKLLATLSVIESNACEIAECLTRENGKPYPQALSEVMRGADAARRMVEAAANLYGAQPIASELELNFQSKFPRGVVACILPWNSPIAVGLSGVFAALSVGNTVIWKPSEKTPLSGLMLARLCFTDLPPGIVSVLGGDGRTGQSLVAHPQVAAVLFTGSEKTGRNIAEKAGGLLKKCVIELGGKDALIVDSDTSPSAAAALAVGSCFDNCGQICTSTERILVHEDIHDAFVDALVEQATELAVGDPFSSEVRIGPLIGADQLALVERHVNGAINAGARLMCGGRRIADRPGYFFQPSVIVDIPETCDLWIEETFGPVAPIAKFAAFPEAVEKVNASRFGLGAIVCTNSADHATFAIKQIQAGMVRINRPRGTPFGGSSEPFGVSGLGYGYGAGLVRELMREKSIMWRDSLLGWLEALVRSKLLLWQHHNPSNPFSGLP